jgi:hypothetical protein
LQEKAAIKAQKDAAEAKYKHALVDGRQEQVGCRALAGHAVSSIDCSSHEQLSPPTHVE